VLINEVEKEESCMKRFKTQQAYFALIMLILSVFLIAGCGSDLEDLLPNPNDDTAPTVLSTEPADGDPAVATNRKIIATFDEAMNPDKITDAGTFTLTGPDGVVAGPVTYSVINHIAIFTPVAPLTTLGTYTATITTAAEDVSGNALAAAKTWSFIAGIPDIIHPIVNSISPANTATDVNTDVDINVIFSEVMDPETVNETTFTLETSDESIHIAGIVTCTGTKATFNPAVNLLPGIEYIARVTIEVKDLAGNILEVEKEWSFKTY
jgi:hypothetical protein